MNPCVEEDYYYYYPQQQQEEEYEDHTDQPLTSNIHPTLTTSPGEASATTKMKKKERKKGRGVQLSTDPQSVAARERRHRISHRLKTLQSMLPGAEKMNTVSLLDHAIHYLHFLNSQIRLHRFFLLSQEAPLPLTLPDPPLLLPPADLPPWPGVAGAFQGDACCFSGDGSTSTLNF